jgi:hypothetical protein
MLTIKIIIAGFVLLLIDNFERIARKVKYLIVGVCLTVFPDPDFEEEYLH